MIMKESTDVHFGREGRHGRTEDARVRGRRARDS